MAKRTSKIVCALHREIQGRLQGKRPEEFAGRDGDTLNSMQK